MMIKSLFILSNIDEKYLPQAVKSLDALLATMLTDETLYHSTLIHKKPKVAAFLEDYAYLGTALIAGYQRTFEQRYLLLAQKMANTALERFYDSGRWYFSRGEFDTEADTRDSSYPGAVGVIVDLLLSLGMLVDGKYRQFAFKTVEYHSFKMAKTPIYFPYFFNQTLRYIKEDRIIKASAERLNDHRKTLSQLHYPYTLTQTDLSSEDFMICGINSCFASTADSKEINNMIHNTF